MSAILTNQYVSAGIQSFSISARGSVSSLQVTTVSPGRDNSNDPFNADLSSSVHAEPGSYYGSVDETPASTNGRLEVLVNNEHGLPLQTEEKDSEPTSDIPVDTTRTLLSLPSSPTPAVTALETVIETDQAAPDTPSEVRSAAMTLMRFLQRNQWQGLEQHRADMDSGLRLRNDVYTPPPEYTEN